MLCRYIKMEEEEEEPVATMSHESTTTVVTSGSNQQLPGEVLIAGSSLIICDDTVKHDGEDDDEDAEITRIRLHEVVFQPIQNDAESDTLHVGLAQSDTAENELAESVTPQVQLAEIETPQVELAESLTLQSELAVGSGIPQIQLEESGLNNRFAAQSDTPQSVFAASGLCTEKNDLGDASRPLQFGLDRSFRAEEYEHTGSSRGPEEHEQAGSSRPERHVHIRESVEIHEASDSSR